MMQKFIWIFNILFDKLIQSFYSMEKECCGLQCILQLIRFNAIMYSDVSLKILVVESDAHVKPDFARRFLELSSIADCQDIMSKITTTVCLLSRILKIYAI